MTTVYLIRHAEAEGNVGRRCHGWYNSLLTQKGEKQAALVGERFQDVPLTAVYSSDLSRAKHTAMAVAKPHGLPVQERQALREINMGDWEDKPWAELPILSQELYDLWCNRPWLCHVPGGESIMESGQRAFAELRRIAAGHDGEEIAVVSHGSAIRGILTLAKGLRPDQMMEVGWGDNTCVAKLLFDTDGGVTVEYANDNSHLPQELSTFASLKWSNSVDVPVSPQMWFRPVNFDDPADRDKAIAYFHLIYYPTYGADAFTDEEIEQRLRGFQSVTPNAVVFGMVDREIGGIIALNTLDDDEPEVGEMGGTYIEPKYRGCGFGQQLMAHAVSVYRGLGKKYLQAIPAVHNPAGPRFYGGQGFVKIGDLHTDQGEFLVMRRKIGVD